MKLIFLASVLISTTSFAGITCGGAQRLAIGDAEVVTSAINQLPLTASVAMDFLNREKGNLGNVIEACEKEFEGKEEFCAKMTTMNQERENGIKWNIKGSESQKNKVRSLNKKLLSTLKIICK